MRITAELIAKGAGCPVERVRPFADELAAVMIQFGINTPARAAAFLAQAAHETGKFKFLKEIWGPTPAQQRYPGGRRYSGRGMFHLTHEYNYKAFTQEARKFYPDAPNFVEFPELVVQPRWAALSAGLFWDRMNRTKKSLNSKADKRDFDAITRIINGGYNGLEDRRNLWASYTRVLAVDYLEATGPMAGEGRRDSVPNDPGTAPSTPAGSVHTPAVAPVPGPPAVGVAGPVDSGVRNPAPVTPETPPVTYEGPAAVNQWLLKSRNVWAALVAGMAAARGVVTDAQEAVSNAEGILGAALALAQKPIFWLTVAGVVGAVAVIVLRAQRHKRGLPE